MSFVCITLTVVYYAFELKADDWVYFLWEQDLRKMK